MQMTQSFSLIELKAMCKFVNRNQQGYVTIEYAIVTAAVTIAILLPVPGSEDSIIEMTLAAIRQFQAHTATMLALP